MKASSFALFGAVAFAFAAQGGDASWKRDISPPAPGGFDSLPPVRMHFAFGWSNVLEAAEADATILRKGRDFRVVVSGGTKGLARTLWMLDVQHTAAVDAAALRPRHFNQIERYRRRTIETQVKFDASGLDRLRKISTSSTPEKWKRIEFAPVFDVVSGILYVRSQPLNVGDRIGLVCFPGDSPYVVVVHVDKRETIRCMGQDRPALRLSLSVRKLEVEKKKPTAAVGYEKFKSGTVWVSDDALRIPLRAEVNVFVGFVYGELTRLERL